MTEKNKALCRTCRDDFYNQNRGGCWSYKSARVVERTQVGVWEEPPYKWNPRATLTCHCPQGRVWLSENDPRVNITVVE